ncbi:hypothetical protein AB6A40_011743 [Gnathostoma spinigerum]|uniref:Uncharacterized protein n=1 Tax=Gnathostoma spinigerum TaxID=75299 RepID=A0ABD6EYH9_9BILA
MNYNGTFAYVMTLCSTSGKTCARFIELQNRPGYSAQINATFNAWNIESSFKWLSNELKLLHNTIMPIFINLHYADDEGPRLAEIINRWFVLLSLVSGIH